ncbi:hypothetical protein MAH1_15330 [Sessilibacter sp. MAH1]
MELKNLINWMGLISGQDRFYREDAVTVHVYGEGDESYIVIEREVSKSPRIVDQYTITPFQNKNSLYELVQFLQTCEFDLNNLVSKIVSADYVEYGMNDVAQFDFVEVARYQVQEN